ncbi:MAG: TylF/MycF/NovP-related O-methyltransferase [Candidatus Saccharimonas sp.]
MIKELNSIEKIVSHRLENDQISEQELRIVLTQLQQTASIEGDVVEFGCYNGATSVAMGKVLQATNKRLFLYDSFQGLPEKTSEDRSLIGMQFTTGELRASKKLVADRFKQAGLKRPVIKKAWFDELTARDLPDKISFAFLDGDYYESVLVSLSLVYPRLQQGAVIVVDDYDNDQLPGASKAVDTWLSTHVFHKDVVSSLAVLRAK